MSEYFDDDEFESIRYAEEFKKKKNIGTIQ